MLSVNPLVNLFCPELFFSERLDKCGQFFLIQRFNVCLFHSLSVVLLSLKFCYKKSVPEMFFREHLPHRIEGELRVRLLKPSGIPLVLRRVNRAG